MAALATRTRMSAAFHPQTDGQPEKANSIVESYLRSFATANVHHWDWLLAMAEFSYSCHAHKATGMSPFEVDTSGNPHIPLDVTAAASRRPGRKAVTVSFAPKMNGILRQLKDPQKASQAATTEAANKARQPHIFEPGDSVSLDARHLSLGYANAMDDVVEMGKGARLSRTLQQRYTGPHRHPEARGECAFELDIPGCLRISQARNIGMFKRGRVDHSVGKHPLCQSASLSAARPKTKWTA